MASSNYAGDPAFYAGGGDPWSTPGWSNAIPFYVTNEGYLKATNANITGTITTDNLTATGGSITNLSATNLTATGGTFTNITVNGDSTFSGALNGATGTFSGNLNAAGGTFKGKLTAATGSFSGQVTASSGSIGG
jgi:hypothetical protein